MDCRFSVNPLIFNMLRLIVILLSIACTFMSIEAAANITVRPDDELIWYHGRWDADRGTWWTGSGFTLHVQNLSFLSLELGANTTQPHVAVGLSVNYGTFINLNLTQGSNEIPLTSTIDDVVDSHSLKTGCTIVRLNVQGWQNNNMYLESLELNPGAKLLRYNPSRLAFQFIGDSLSAGQYLVDGVDGAWPFLTGEYFKAEHNINAQPGACLTDQVCWGNAHGLSYQFFKTEDTGYYYNPKHNFTTDWDFRRDYPPTHIFLEAGANDNAYNITAASITSTYVEFISKLRELYPQQPLFVVGAWGWPNSDGTVGYYYEGVFEKVVEQRHAAGDNNVYYIDTKGWVEWEDVFPANQHPSPSGHAKIAGLLEAWLEKWGLQPQADWSTP